MHHMNIHKNLINFTSKFHWKLHCRNNSTCNKQEAKIFEYLILKFILYMHIYNDNYNDNYNNNSKRKWKTEMVNEKNRNKIEMIIEKSIHFYILITFWNFSFELLANNESFIFETLCTIRQGLWYVLPWNAFAKPTLGKNWETAKKTCFQRY